MADVLSIANRVLEHFNYATGSLVTAPGARILGHLNQWHRRLLNRPGFELLRATTVQVASVANTPTLALPPWVAKVLKVRDTANRLALEEQSFDWYRTQEPDTSASSGTPSVYVRLGPATVRAIPASGLWLVSSEAADSMNAVVTGGSATALRSVTVTLNGTTRVQVGSDEDWASVGVTLASAATGIVSVYDAAADGNVLVAIPIGDLQYTAPQLALWPAPSTAITYTLDVERAIKDLTATDVPWLPDDFHWLLEQGAKVSEYERLDDTRLTVARRELEVGVSELRHFLTSSADRILVPGSRHTGYSRLNAWCPADRMR